MTDNLKGIEQATQLATTEEAQIHGSPQRNGLILSAGIFVIALVAALLQNTRKPVQELAMLFDSGAYVMSTKYVLTAAQNFMHGMPFESALKSVSETLMLNGPVLPVLGATYFAAIAKEPSLIDMRAPIVLQAVIHATAATTLALAGWRLTGGRKLGLTAGLILAVWPSAVIGAGRFLTWAQGCPAALHSSRPEATAVYFPSPNRARSCAGRCIGCSIPVPANRRGFSIPSKMKG